MTRTVPGVRAGLDRVFRLFVLVALVAVMIPVSAPEASAVVLPQTLWVDIANGSDTNTGTEAEPFKTITHAVFVSGSADTIVVMPGTYSEANGETLPITLSGQSLVSAEGAETTIIQGDSTEQLLLINQWAEGDELAGFTFADGGAGTGDAAVEVIHEVADGAGSATISENIFTGNSAANGGALSLTCWVAGWEPVVAYNEFDGNTGSTGGAMRVSGPMSATIVGNLFVNNSASNGGALHMTTAAGACTVEMNTFSSNSAVSGGSGGGAVYWNGSYGASAHSIRANSFWGNQAGVVGGALYLINITTAITGNDASGNTSNFMGGFAYLEFATVSAENNLLTDGASANYGAAWTVDPNSTLVERNDTVVGMGTGPQAMYVSDTGNATITNCIYWNPLLADEMTSASSVSYSCVSSADSADLAAAGNTVGAGMLYMDPGFAAGGQDLDPSSPCIDAANPADFPEDDFYGTPRPFDGNGDLDALPDIGYYEYALPSIVIEDNAAGVTFDRFVPSVSPAYSDGTYIYGRWTGTRIEARFTGTTIAWVGPKQPSYGMADVYLDNVKVATVDCYASNADKTLSTTIWSSAPLAPGAHTISIRLMGAKNAASAGNIVAVDNLVTTDSGTGVVGTRANETAGTFTGAWIPTASTTYTGGTYRYSRWAGAKIRYSFTGTQVAWIGPRALNYGRAEVWIDNVKKATVSQYGVLGWRYRVWESAALTAGPHTIEIRVLGTKDAASANTIVVVDGFDVKQ